jgi:hypothetical protein
MADLVITASNVVPVSTDATNSYVTGITNAAITAGQSVYYDSSTGLYGLFDADSATAAVHTLVGIAVSSAPASGSAVVVQTGGTVALGTVLTKGLLYVGGAGTAGAVAPSADLGSGDYIHLLGLATSTSVLWIKVVNTLTAI